MFLLKFEFINEPGISEKKTCCLKQRDNICVKAAKRKNDLPQVFANLRKKMCFHSTTKKQTNLGFFNKK